MTLPHNDVLISSLLNLFGCSGNLNEKNDSEIEKKSGFCAYVKGGGEEADRTKTCTA